MRYILNVISTGYRTTSASIEKLEAMTHDPKVVGPVDLWSISCKPAGMAAFTISMGRGPARAAA